MENSGDLPNMTSKLTIPLDALVRSVEVNKHTRHAFLLGAGASITSGMYSAGYCIWDWKRRIFLTRNASLRDYVADISVPSVQQRVQRWIDLQGGNPVLGTADEYGHYIEKCFPIPQDRRAYFQDMVAKARPHVGYKLLGLLAEAGLVDSVWTTNFDSLTVRAAAEFQVTPIEVGLDSVNRVARAANQGELIHVSLHGDYRYDNLKNTPKELQEQDTVLRSALVSRAIDGPLIVMGYSGRDQSIMQSLMDAYSKPGPGRLFWCGHEQEEPSDAVATLLRTARAVGRDAYYVNTSGFDGALIRLAMGCLPASFQARAQEISAESLRGLNALPSPFEIQSGTLVSVIKSNVFPVQVPNELFQFEVSGFDEKLRWKQLDSLISEKQIAAVFKGSKIISLGDPEEIKTVFSAYLSGEIERIPIIESDLKFEDGIVTSVLKQAIIIALAKNLELENDRDSTVWTTRESSPVSCYGENHKAYPAALLFLRRYGRQLCLVIKPTLKVFRLNGERASSENDKEAKRLLLTKQYNKEFAGVLDRWQTTLCPEKAGVYNFPVNSKNFVTFTVERYPCYSGLTTAGKSSSGISPISFPLNRLKFSGTLIQEPSLVFSNKSATGLIKDDHPLRGITQNRPFDFPLTQTGLNPDVKVGVICPASDAKALETYLARLHSKISADSKDQYLIDYPGFANALGTPIDIPAPGGIRWQTCTDPNLALDKRAASTQLLSHLKSCIDSLTAAHSPNVILIFIPKRWKTIEAYEIDQESFDLHNQIKAYCVKKGVATQLLREETLTKSYQCEVVWWLAMSLYVKSFRTPWILDDLDRGTAYVGIGFGYDRLQKRDQRVILGCSHIYDATGQGLRYKLSKIETPIWRNRNPHLSKDDARKLGDTIRQLFFESSMSLPRRVVIHKRTPFLRDEREGLLEGLGSIESVDMLEITVDPAFRGIASRMYQGKLQPDMFPVKRGTVIALDQRKALVWVHGSAPGIQQNRTYYLGKSRIPAPLIVKRHFGHTALATLAQEVLGLSKMNWNSFDLYNKLPATLESSTEIARIGSLLERFGPLSYDYRLFI